jgi:hypothetical protein
MTARRPEMNQRVYRALVRLYPAGFRGRFGDEMVMLLGDQLRDARDKAGRMGTFQTWLATIKDLAWTVPAEHTAHQRTVARSLPGPGDYAGIGWQFVPFVMWLTDAWFGIVTAVLGVVSRWAAWSLAVGAVLQAAATHPPNILVIVGVPWDLVTALAFTGIVLIGIGLAGLGLDLVVRRRAPTEPASPRVP